MSPLATILAMLTTLTALLGGPGGPAVPAPSEGVWPLRPRPEIVRGFDPPSSPWGSGHRGVDLLGRVGESVYAAEAGRVAFVGRIAGVAVVVVDHGATRTTYEPVASTVRPGQAVAAGDRIGRLELFGSHCLPRACLHWGLIAGAEEYLNPLTLVGAGPVRLLPLSGAVLGLSWTPARPPARTVPARARSLRPRPGLALWAGA